MSLLMKALQRAEKTSAEAGGGNGLQLEPMVEMPRASGAAATRVSAPDDARQAANLFQAKEQLPASGNKRVLVLAGIAVALALIGAGAWVYISLLQTPTIVAMVPPPLTQRIAPAPIAPATATAPPAAAQAQSAPKADASAATTLTPPPAAHEETPSTPAAEVPAAPKAAGARRDMRAGKQATAKSRKDDAGVNAPQAESGAGILIGRGGTQPAAVNPVIASAYDALKQGRFEEADAGYRLALQSTPDSVDALLGAAAASIKLNKTDAAIKNYIKVLELDPRNSTAQAGLIGLLGDANPAASETRLKGLIAQAPSGFLYFTLGNLYAQQSRWAEAQQSYFNAHSLDPGNPEYCFNLAVGLDHISQPKIALGFYQQALQLARDQGATFDKNRVSARIDQLQRQLQPQ